MQKRLSLALILSVAVLFGWNLLFPPPQRPPAEGSQPAGTQPSTPGTASAGSESSTNAAAKAAPPEGTVIAASEAEELTLFFGRRGEPGFYRATFSNRGGRLIDLRLGNYFDTVGLGREERGEIDHWAQLIGEREVTEPAPGGLLLETNASSAALTREPLSQALWQMEPLGSTEVPEGVRFTYAPGTGVVFRKTLRPDPGHYRLSLELEIENLDAAEHAGLRQFVFVPSAFVPRDSSDNFYIEPKVVAAGRAEGGEPSKLASVQRDDRGKTTSGPLKVSSSRLSFAGVHNKYFAFLMRGAEGDEVAQQSMLSARYRRTRDLAFERENPDKRDRSWQLLNAEIDLQLAVPEPGQAKVYHYTIFAGPKDRGLLEADYSDHRLLVEKDLGFFSGIASLLLGILGFFHGIIGNWGWSIILLTASVRLILFPVNRRSQTAMARYQTKMKRLQPRIDEIKKKYAKDSQRQRQEQAKLMQEEGAFPPLGGCLPIFVQIPIFIGLFQALRTNFDLRHAPFLGWIQDLSMPDRFLRIDLGLPIFGTIEYLNVLPPLMVISWVVQQRAMPKPADEQAARMQKMMMWMPVMMGFFLYNYAAGLSLYMITQSVLGLFETRVIKKYWPVDDIEKGTKKSGFMARLAEAQKQHMAKRERALKDSSAKGGSKQRPRSKPSGSRKKSKSGRN